MYYVKYANKTTSYSVFTIYKYVRKRKRDIEKFAIVATSQRSNVLRMVRLVCERQSGAVVNIAYVQCIQQWMCAVPKHSTYAQNSSNQSLSPVN